jgi:hypothetical protein
MKAYIVHDSPLGSDYWGEGMYELITEKEQVIYKRWCTNRAFANHDLTIGVQTMLQDNGVTEVYSNGVVVWSDGKISKDADADFRSANYEYERVNSDAR